MDVDNEQMFHDLEQRHVSLRKEHEATCAERDALKYKTKSLQDSLNELRDQFILSDKKISDCNSDIRQRDNQIKELIASQEELSDRYKRRSDEIDRLREELKNQSGEFTNLQNRLKESQLALSETQSKHLPAEFELTRLTHEKAQLEMRVQSVEEELRAKTKEARQQHNDFNEKLHTVESRLHGSEAAINDYLKQLDVYQDQASNQQEKLAEYLLKLKEAESSAVIQQTAFVQENESLKRLVELYKRYFEEATSKVEQLERETQALKEAHVTKTNKLKETITLQFESRENEVELERLAAETRISELETQVGDLSQQLQSKRDYSTVVTVENCGAATGRSAADFDGIGITEMYDRVVSVERELLAERDKRRDAELYMNQILKDIEGKAPVIAGQRRDYHRIVESHTRLTHKMDVLVSENAELRTSLQHMEKRTAEAVHEAAALEQHNADLSTQLQHVLRQSMGHSLGNGPSSTGSNRSGANAGEVISDYLLTFNDVAELQLRNEQLLKVVRKLSHEQEQEAVLQLTNGPVESQSSREVSEALKAALSELTSMREARRRTEDMVAGLVQQRDLYRAIAEETDTTRAHTPSKASTALTAVGSPNSEQGRVSDLQWKLTQAEDERRRLQERMNRLEEAEKLTHESLDRIRGEASAVRMEAAQANSDARFQRERAERLDISLKAAQLESASALQRRLDIERTLIDLQREIRTKDDKVAELSDQLRSSADAQRRADIEVEVAKASETRVVAQLCEAREEVKRHASLAEYLQRIEAGLQSKAEEDKEALVREKDALTRAYETLRRQVDERGLIEDQRLRCLEDDLRSAKSRLDEKTSEATAVSSELIREQCIAKAAQERSSLLEKQLSIAQERLNASQGVQIMDSISTSEAAAKELQFERSVAEVESLKAQLAASEGHAEQFRRISTANEASLKELRAKSQETRAVQEAEASRLQTERDSAVRELAEHRASTVTLLNEVEESREQLRAANSANAESTRAHQEQLALARQESEQLREQLELLKADAVKFQAAAKSAFANYERELQMHAQAEKDLREKDRELEVTKDSLSAAQQRAASLSADCLRKESVLEEERGKFEAESQLLQSQLEGLQRTNDLLHAQVQSFGVQIDRLQDTRLAAASLEQNVGTNDANQQPSTMNVEELMELRKSNLEIREVLRYLKKEKDMLAAKLAVVETENNRHLGELHVVNRALDEARAELKRELDRRVVVRSEEEFSRLLSEVTQLNLVRESNAHLRGENEELSRRVVTLTDELRVQKTAKVPLEEALRKSQADKESMELINDQLNNDVGYWRDRLQKLVSRYNDVDPEEHRLLKAQLEEVQIALADLQKVSAAQVLENTAALEARDKELSALKVTAQSQEKGANNLRDRLRQFKVAKDAVDAKLVESGKLVASRETELTALGAQLTAVQTEVVTLTASLATAQAEIIAVKSAPVSQIVEAALSSVPTVVPEVNIVAPVVAPTKKRDRATHEAETTTTTTIAPAIAPTLIVAGASETATPSSGAAPVVEENKMKQLLKQKAQNIAIAKKKAAAAAAAQQSTEVTVAEPIVAAAPVGKKARVAIAPSLSDTVVEVSETPSVPDNSSTVVMDTEANAPAIISAPLTIEAPETVSSAAEPASVEMLTEPIAPTVDAPVAAIPEAKKIGSGNPFSSATTPVAKPAVNIFGASAVTGGSIFGQGVVSGPFGGVKASSSLVFGKPAAPAVEPEPNAEPMTGEEGELLEESRQQEEVLAKSTTANTPLLFGSASGPFSGGGSSSAAQSFAGFGSSNSGMFGAKFGAGVVTSTAFGASAPVATSGLFGKPAATSGTQLSFGGATKGVPVFGSSALNAAAAPFSFGATSTPGFGNVMIAPALSTPIPVVEAPVVVETTAVPAIVSIPQTVGSTTPAELEAKKALRAARFSAGGGAVAQIDGTSAAAVGGVQTAGTKKRLSKGAIANALAKQQSETPKTPSADSELEAGVAVEETDESGAVDDDQKEEE